MLTHDEIWLAIDRLATKYGYSPSGLAKHAGLDPTSFNKSKRFSPDDKPRWPSTESISKILAATNCTMSDFIALIGVTAAPFDKGEMAKMTAKILLDTKSVLFNAKEPFTLKSGRQSPVYIDCRRLVSFPEARSKLMNAAAQLISNEIGLENIDYVAGGETAGIPYGAFIADRVEKPMIYVRKAPKGYGRMGQIEGHLPEKMEDGSKPKVILVEDLQTDGGSKEIFINALRMADAEVSHTFVIFHYGIFPASEENMEKMGINLLSLATWWDVLALAKAEKYFDKATLKSVESFLKDPNSWEPEA
tara:strand:- start:424 stop:1335 length:912 start_codon:yes stop_codon:yes gene_type:complete